MLRPVLSKAWGLFLLAPTRRVLCRGWRRCERVPVERPGISPSNDAMGPSIAFLDSDLQFVPGDTREITAVVEPPDVYEVRLSLSGDFGDAFLDRSQVETGTDGMASATLTAPSSAHTFTVRASVGAKSASLPVSAGTGFSNVEVKPHYAGTRAVTTSTATVRTGSSCRSLLESPRATARSSPTRHRMRSRSSPMFRSACRSRSRFARVTSPAGARTSTERSRDPRFLGRRHRAGSPFANGGHRSRRRARNRLEPRRGNGVERRRPKPRREFRQPRGNRRDGPARLNARQIPSSSADARDAFRTARAAKGRDALLERSLHDGLGADGLRGLVGSLNPRSVAEAVSRRHRGNADFKGRPGPRDLRSFGVRRARSLLRSARRRSAAYERDHRHLDGRTRRPGPLRRRTKVAAFTARRGSCSGTGAHSGQRREVRPGCARAYPPLHRGRDPSRIRHFQPAYADCGAACVQKLCEGALNLMWIRAAYSPKNPTLVDFAATASAKVGDDAKPVSFRRYFRSESLRVGEVIDKVGGTTITTAGAH